MWWFLVAVAFVLVLALLEWRSWRRPVGRHLEGYESGQDHDRHLTGGVDI